MIKLLSNVRFGPAGNPLGYNGETVNICNYIRKRGLDAYEYQASYGVRISKQSALKLKKNAKVNDVVISMHAPYYINLSSNKDDVIERSIQRLIQSAKAAEKLCSTGVSNYTFAPETTGKKSQLGSLEEIIEICRTHENFTPTIDFAHLHARSGGGIKNKEDYKIIFEKLENELDLKSIHSHFTSIEFTDKGERRHHALFEDNYGPPLEPLLEEIAEVGWNITVICETPKLDEDALVMQKIYNNIIKN